jgi:hypothetical protein
MQVWYDDCVPRIRILDASTGDHQEEEDFYKEKGEENLDPHFNQGKLIFLQAKILCKIALIETILLQANILAQCKAPLG